ncbi:MAG TPA: hypothetical protein VKA38_00815, partial [Draconibacterium sp.]|nr:hypothetical protein [Draconibacterium sp.]
MKRSMFFTVTLMFFIYFTNLNAQTQKSEYKIAGSIHLTGDGGWDYLAVDEINQNLFVSHSTQVNVVSLKTNKQI